MEVQGLEEKTLVLFKPDAVKRGIVGEILSRFERIGLKIVGLKLMEVTREFASKHYPSDKDYVISLGQKTLDNYKKYDLDPNKELGTSDPYKIGQIINQWNAEYLSSGPLIAMVLQGNHAVDNVRKLVGHTLPVSAEPGTIRGDFSKDSSALANKEKRALRNIIHASGTTEEAKSEIEYWFKKDELFNYQRADEAIMFRG